MNSNIPHCDPIRYRTTLTLAIALLLGPAMAPAQAPPPQQSAFEHIRRLNPHLVADDPRELPMKLRSIIQDGVSFFRGTTDLFYEWCAKSCADWMRGDAAGHVQLHGDLHIGNLGTHPETDGSAIAPRFGVVDFDETIRGPYQFDLLRGLTALRFAAASRGTRLDDDDWHEIATDLCKSYANNMASRAPEKPESDVKKLLEKAAKGRWDEHLAKYAESDGAQLRFRRTRLKKKALSDIMEPTDPERWSAIVKALAIARLAGTDEPLSDALGFSSREVLGKAVVDIARWTRLGSSGSQGLHKYLVLIDLRMADAASPDSARRRAARVGRTPHLLIELKEEPSPAAARAGLLPAAASGANRAREIAEAHAILWGAAPPMIGHASISETGFLLRMKDPWSEELDDKDFKKKKGLRRAARIMGSVIAEAHFRSLGAAGEGIPARAAPSAEEVIALVPILVERSQAAETHLNALYDALRKDTEARKLVASAEAFIADAASPR